MRSNVALRSNVYINKTHRRNDPDFVRQLRDYRSLCRYYDPIYRTAEAPLTEVQYAILQQGAQKCALESGTMSWGVPIGSERFVCRCEKTDCHWYPICSRAENFSSDGLHFDILFDGCQIGRTSAVFTSALLEGFRATNKNANMPANITSAYISALVTVIDPGGAEREDAYRSSGCWLGVELGGFAHINYT